MRLIGFGSFGLLGNFVRPSSSFIYRASADELRSSIAHLQWAALESTNVSNSSHNPSRELHSVSTSNVSNSAKRGASADSIPPTMSSMDMKMDRPPPTPEKPSYLPLLVNLLIPEDTVSAVENPTTRVMMTHQKRPIIYSAGPDEEFDPIDLTNFDGDDDTLGPGEANLSYQIRKEGQLRRRATRGRPQSVVSHWPQDPNAPPLPGGAMHNEAMIDQAHHRLNSDAFASTADLITPQMHHRMKSDPQFASTIDLLAPHMRSESMGSTTISTHAPSARVHHHPGYPPSEIGGGVSLKQMLKEEDAHAKSVLSTFCSSGRAPLDDIIASEIDRARGRIAVTCEFLLFLIGCFPELELTRTFPFLRLRTRLTRRPSPQNRRSAHRTILTRQRRFTRFYHFDR